MHFTLLSEAFLVRVHETVTIHGFGRLLRFWARTKEVRSLRWVRKSDEPFPPESAPEPRGWQRCPRQHAAVELSAEQGLAHFHCVPR
jgi:hypothetical protein